MTTKQLVYSQLVMTKIIAILGLVPVKRHEKTSIPSR